MVLSFNIVIGRPTLIKIGAVVSQSHICMKFPTPMGVATLIGNQEIARHYYMTFVTQPRKDKEAPQLLEPPQPKAPSNQQVMGVELLDNNPEDETRATLVEEVEEVWINDSDPTKKTHQGRSVEALTSRICEKVDYCEWFANLVLVKKSNDKWRMCIDCTNLNDACPKDCYLMPSIDKLVEAGSRIERLSLLDAYSGYHQVHMAPEDEGIEVNYEKIKAIGKRKPSRSIKDVQHLMGWETTLHRFISKSTDKCMPFFKTLSSAAHKDKARKPKKFEWTLECQATFDELKAYLSSPPLLIKVEEGERFFISTLGYLTQQ
ncbi:hypothetical protein SLEP1_g36067 [Rubroshorea leprosula]|uniref:Transposon Ty3-I Gag-Pol polyprotein n=1 Tax=Rubroshorea leprosula TaxID=152421 RepID=A0AAV5KQE1_9ROSI|nr:hypothetical protein SLEP1_g36067 [Rubroshorea leprosula]